jgi:hypothetical protein
VASGASASRVLRAAAARARKNNAYARLKNARVLGVRSSLPMMACYLPAFLLLGVVPIIGGMIGKYVG